jgi:hypothetical protein
VARATGVARAGTAVRAVLAFGVLAGLTSCTGSNASKLAAAEQQIRDLKVQLSAVSQNAFSGGGVNVKMMPDPVTGKPTVPMDEVFSFNRSYAMCQVATNTQAFKMTTYAMGDVTIQPNQFYMAMDAASIDEIVITTLNNGDRQVKMTGGLNCSTEVGQAKIKIGSRTAPEHARYEITAVDSGVGGGQAGDTFAFKTYFKKDEAPVNYGIFGPEATFTGQMVSGEIIIVDPADVLSASGASVQK